VENAHNFEKKNLQLATKYQNIYVLKVDIPKKTKNRAYQDTFFKLKQVVLVLCFNIF